MEIEEGRILLWIAGGGERKENGSWIKMKEERVIEEEKKSLVNGLEEVGS